MNLLEALSEKVLIGDGAIGTLLYSYGIDRSFEELNRTHPEEILRIHQAYVNAGSNVIQTNSYGANYIKLSRYGLAEQVKKLNSAAVKIARQAAGNQAFVVGTIGGIHGAGPTLGLQEEIKRSFREQLYCLLHEGVDGILLETYFDIEELAMVLEIAREETDLPIITNVSMHEPGVLQNGIQFSDALHRLETLGANVVGVNCRLGPHHILKALESVPIPQKAFLSAYPNASMPEYEDGKLLYKTEPNYFERFGELFRQQGVRLMGGCCGTTPEHIAALVKGVDGKSPITKKVVKKQSIITIAEKEKVPAIALHETVKLRNSVIVELGTPRNLETDIFFEAANALKEAKVDCITLADNSLASPRICNMAMATRLEKEVGIPSIVHISCRDRNLIGMQSHLMGLHTLGIRDVLAITGDPTKVGDFPGATSVFDVTSFELIRMIKQLNKGISPSGKSLKQKTSFNVAAAFNPNIRNVSKAVERLEKKIEYGADFIMTQPIFCKEKIVEVKEATKHLDVPIFIGIMPIVSAKNAEFLHNEVPGIKLTDDVRSRMAAAPLDPNLSRKEGLVIAKELIDTVLEHFNGVYLITPFYRYELSVELAQYIHVKTTEGALELVNK